MRRTCKKSLTFVLALILALSMAGCRQEPQAGGGSTQETGGQHRRGR